MWTYQTLTMKVARAALTCAVLLSLPATASAYRTAEDLPQFTGAGPIGWRQTSVEFIVSDVEHPRPRVTK